MDFRGNYILSIDQFDRSDIEKLFSVADKLEPYASKEKITEFLKVRYWVICFLNPVPEQNKFWCFI